MTWSVHLYLCFYIAIFLKLILQSLGSDIPTTSSNKVKTFRAEVSSRFPMHATWKWEEHDQNMRIYRISSCKYMVIQLRKNNLFSVGYMLCYFLSFPSQIHKFVHGFVFWILAEAFFLLYHEFATFLEEELLALYIYINNMKYLDTNVKDLSS